MSTEPTIKFTLHLTIEGHSLEDIDFGLSKAATERIMSRKPHLKPENNMPQGMKLKVSEGMHPVAEDKQPVFVQEVVKTQEIDNRIEQAANAAVNAHIEKEKKGKGRPKKTEAEHLEQKIEAPTQSAPLDEALTKTTQVAPPTPTKEDAISALSKVNEKYGIDSARAILSQFNVKRLAELDASKYSEFIYKCENQNG